MRTAAYIVWLLAQLYLLVLVVRMVFGLLMSISQSWRPKKAMAAVAEVVFLVTDPPLRVARRIIKPVRIGPMALDLAFLVVFVVVSVVAYGAAAVIGSGAV
ncbi:MAG: YggT family protein [Bifidobacteriaceae bacterium]|nr:YggT family protein [Bifidobacteriaceae bacterium]